MADRGKKTDKTAALRQQRRRDRLKGLEARTVEVVLSKQQRTRLARLLEAGYETIQSAATGCHVLAASRDSMLRGRYFDATVRRGLGFAMRIGASDLIFVNAATGIATNADPLAGMKDPVGSMADEARHVEAEFCLSRGGMLIAAWGVPKGKAVTRHLMDSRFEAILRLCLPLHVLRLTGSGYPEHPLRLPAGLSPVPWNYQQILRQPHSPVLATGDLLGSPE